MNDAGRYEAKIDEPYTLKHSLLGKENHPCTMLLSFMTTIKAIWPWLHSSWRRSLALLEKPLIVPICTGKEDGFMHDALSLKQEIEETILKCLVESLSMISLSRVADISCPLVYASLVAGHPHMRAAQEILYLMHQND